MIKEIKDIKTKKNIKAYLYQGKITGGKEDYPKNEILKIKWLDKKDIEEMKDKLRHSWVLEGLNKLEKSIGN